MKPKETILITGTTGFIGKHLVKSLANNESYRVVTLSSTKTPGVDFINHKNYTFRANDFLRHNVKRIDCVIHAGSYTPKSKSEANNISGSFSNITSTYRLLNELPSTPHKIIYLSTIDVYGSLNKTINEKCIPSPQNQYARSKLYCEYMIKEWSNQKNVQSQILRIGHIFGPGEEAYKKFIPTIFQNIINNKEMKLTSDGKEKRSYLVIDDCIRFIINALKLKENVGEINIVSEQPHSINEILSKIGKVTGKSKMLKSIKRSENSGESIIFDATKRKRVLGKEMVTIDEGLEAEYQHLLRLNTTGDEI